MPRGTIQMRVRRRQSDAKWRASVATCYETLKHIIPNNDKMPKRKISKALILQETENHLLNIENKFRDLLEQKAKARGKAVVLETDSGMVEATLEDLRRDFSSKQQSLFVQNCSQRKKSNIPSDLEVGLIDLRSSMCNLSVVPLDCLQEVLLRSTDNDEAGQRLGEEDTEEDVTNLACSQQSDTAVVPTMTCNDNIQPNVSKVESETLDINLSSDLEALPPRTPVKSRRGRPSRRHNDQYLLSRVVSPEHSRISENFSCFNSENFHERGQEIKEYAGYHSLDRTPTQKGKRGRDTRSRTPVRSTKQRLFESHSGFTPVKLPDLVPVTPGTPTSCPKQCSPFTALSSDNQGGAIRDDVCMVPDLLFSPLDTANLLCTESMDLMDLDDGYQDNEQTPHFGRKKKKTRKEDRQSRDSTAKSKGKTCRSRSSHTRTSKALDCPKAPVRPQQARKCRRQLEKSFPAPEDKTASDITAELEKADITSCQDFDGYFMFYQQFVADQESESPETASHVAQMWRSMSQESREAFMAMAALDTQSSGSSDLSDDLLDLEIEPIISDCFRSPVRDGSTCQMVPVCPLVPVAHSSGQTVPNVKPLSPTLDITRYQTYRDMFDPAMFDIGSISQAADMISTNQFLDQGSSFVQMTTTAPAEDNTQLVPEIDLLMINHLTEVDAVSLSAL